MYIKHRSLFFLALCIYYTTPLADLSVYFVNITLNNNELLRSVEIMDKKNIERPKKFYKREYDKTHYSQFNLRIKPELKKEIDDFCAEKGISKSEFLRLAIEALKKEQ